MEYLILRSDEVKKGFQRAPHRSLFKAAGVKEEDFGKPFINILFAVQEAVKLFLQPVLPYHKPKCSV